VSETSQSINSSETRDSIRYQWLIANPRGARHLFLLLEQGKGDKVAFTEMVDRIINSEAAAQARKAAP
jgi:hypothetical protein